MIYYGYTVIIINYDDYSLRRLTENIKVTTLLHSIILIS